MIALFHWRDKKWRKRALGILTFIVLVMIVSHPELRLLFPLVDALGIDVLLTLLSVQFLSLLGDYVKPALGLFYRNVLLPLSGKMHSLFLFLGGPVGHLLTVKFYACHARLLPAWQR